MKRRLWAAMAVIVLAGCTGARAAGSAPPHVEDEQAGTSVVWSFSSDCAGIGRVFAAETEGLTLQDAINQSPHATCRWTSEQEYSSSILRTFTVAIDPLGHDDVLLGRDMVMGLMGGTELHHPQIEKLNGYALATRIGDVGESINILVPYALVTASATRPNGRAELEHASTVERLASLLRRR